MRVGSEILELAGAGGARSLFVVGTGKDVGKTVAMRAVAEAAAQRGLRVGMTSTGRDGEVVDASDAVAKPRIFLRPGALVATARGVLPAHPASELLDLTHWRTAAGPVVFASVRRAGYYELAGPSTASGIRGCVDRFTEFGCDRVLVDGALDRVAALAGGGDAIVIAGGASAARTIDEAAEELGALAARLRIAQYDAQRPFVKIEGALAPAAARALAAAGEKRQVVVRDPTQVAASGKALLGMRAKLDIRCERPLNVVAVTIASIGRDRYFEPRAFARAAASATGLPVFDVYAGTMTSAA